MNSIQQIPHTLQPIQAGDIINVTSRPATGQYWAAVVVNSGNGHLTLEDQPISQQEYYRLRIGLDVTLNGQE